jgi:hypothetical protein
MPVTITKPQATLRELLAGLKKRTGLFGEQIMRTENAADFYNVIGQNRNRIINGAMTIDQRNAGASVSLTGVTGFVVDRWNTVVRPTGGGTITGQQISDAPAGFSNSTRLTVNTADTSLASLDYYFHWQKIEGFNTYDLAFGTANASPVTVSFWVKSSVPGQFSTFLINATENYSCAIPYTINTANTWERKVITFSGAIAGTWVGSTNGTGLMLGFGLASGAGLLGTPGVWGAASYYGSTGDTNWMATSGNTWQITGVQLERGTVATPFEYRSYGQELALCQRYYQRVSGFVCGSGTAGLVGCSTSVMFKTEMRASPSVGLTAVLSVTQVNSNDYTQSSINVSIAGAGARVSTLGVNASFDNFPTLPTNCPLPSLVNSGVLTLSAEL